MRDFLRGWKRKLGVMILLFACAFMVGWIRSFCVLDRCFFSQSQSMHALFSMDGVLSWRKLTPFAKDLPSSWSEGPKWIPSSLTQQSLDNYKIYWNDGDIHWHWQSLGFDFGDASFEMLGTAPNQTWIRREKIWQIPYWSIVIPLTSLAAHLLISKPQQVRQSNAFDTTATQRD